MRVMSMTSTSLRAGGRMRIIQGRRGWAVAGEKIQNPPQRRRRRGRSRLQATLELTRSKSGVFLVRTDGFMCTRENVKNSKFLLQSNTHQHLLTWETPPQTVLVLKKIGNKLMPHMIEIVRWLAARGMTIVVEPDVLVSLHEEGENVDGICTFQTKQELLEGVDFCVCLGGDGIILHASNLFPQGCPPLICFNLGSLGFLANHSFSEFADDLTQVIEGNSALDGVYVQLRMRLRCELYRRGKPMEGKKYSVLNEVCVDRGSASYLAKIECYERDRLITNVQADGVMVATPTGSTAYNVSAGGAMVHPSVPAILFTPICPHSLSFRPVLLPDSAELELRVPDDARSSAWVSFDGKFRQQLSHGDAVKIRMYKYPMPTINKYDQTDDWFQSLVRCLRWNDRVEQSPDWH